MTINGDAGSNTIFGSADEETINGGGGNDLLYGAAGNDLLNGDEGDDTLSGGPGADTLDGGSGSDTADYSGSASVIVDLEDELNNAGAALDDRLTGVENVIGGDESDELSGDDSGNILSGRGGNDVLDGRSGNDTLIGGAGADTLIGGEGIDTAVYASSAGVYVSLTPSSMQTGEAFGDVFIGIENVTGSDAADSLSGDSAANVLSGQGGNDYLDGHGGSDTLIGGAGDDEYTIDVSTDVIVEGPGGGHDVIFTSISYTLSDTVEVEELEAYDADESVSINLTGNRLANVLVGHDGANELDGGDGDDVIDGGFGDDTLLGGRGDDTLRGASGNDGQGADLLEGGEGIDTVSYESPKPARQATLVSGSFISLADPSLNTGAAAGDQYRSIENVTAGDTDDTIIGSSDDNVLSGKGGNDSLDGGAGNDTLIGGAGADTLAGGGGIDTAFYEAENGIGVAVNLADPSQNEAEAQGDTYNGIENVTGTQLDDIITGDGLANVLSGRAGKDTLRGGAGDDTLEGGRDGDHIYGDDGNDYIVSRLGDGADKLIGGADLDFVFIDRSTWTGNFDFDLGSNAELDAGNIRSIDDGTQLAGFERIEFHAGSGSDTLSGANLDDVLFGNGNNDVLNGGNGNDLLDGGVDNDTINGGAGADTLNGGSGNDLYLISQDGGDVIVEAAGNGTDTIVAHVSYTLNDAAEVEVMIAAEGVGAISLAGSRSANTLIGNAEANVLDGRGGADTMRGGAGDDTYSVDHAGDVIDESTGSGIDTVIASLSFSLAGMSVERLIASGTGNIVLTGNETANVLTGNAGDNQLSGAIGDDTLHAGAGNDTLDGGTGADVLDGGDGFDTVSFANAMSGVVTNMNKGIAGDAAGDVYTSIEQMIGSSFGDTLLGDAGRNTLMGGAGGDRLNGGSGNDVLWGQGGKDLFVFDSKPGNYRTDRKVNFDTIADYKVGQDRIWLDNKYFKKLGTKGSEKKPAKLNKDFFSLDKAKDKNDHLIYNKKTGVLSYDADGSGKGQAVEIAQLSKKLKLTYKDFYII